MTTDKLKFELERDFVQEIFESVDLTLPEIVTEKEFKTALILLKNQEKSKAAPQSTPENEEQPAPPAAFPAPAVKPAKPTINQSAKRTPPQQSRLEETNENTQKPKNRPKTVLIVDDLGIIIYQMSVLFKKLGFEVVTSQEVYDAIEKYKKQDFGYVVLDFFIPTEREGLFLLDEIKKLSLLCKLDTKIISMSATTRESFKTQAKNHGANIFIEKSVGWQRKIIEECIEDLR